MKRRVHQFVRREKIIFSRFTFVSFVLFFRVSAIFFCFILLLFVCFLFRNNNNKLQRIAAGIKSRLDIIISLVM
jgi:ABC-type transport system involved in multi-copper enzyme maturation permease subunit